MSTCIINARIRMEKRFSPFKGAINPLDDNEEGCGRVNHYGAYYATIQESKFSPFDENGKSSTCNTCIKLFGVNEVVVEVIGICEGCENNSLEISDKAMEDLTGGKEIDLGEIEWKYIACPSK
ncbi:hypothetical protein GGI07_002395 [Coemansia sp. Benny D115]|nr:hypothetical protein GGI07_002395 [Coemansia sp. Benny D115]